MMLNGNKPSRSNRDSSLPGDIGAVDQAADEQEYADGHDNIAKKVKESPPTSACLRNQYAFQCAGLFQPCHPGGSLVSGVVQAGAAFKHGPIHGKIVATQMRDEKVNDKDVAHGQDRLDPVDPKGHVKPPAWHVSARHQRVGQEQAGYAQDGYPPENGPVIEFFPIAPAIELRMLGHTQKPAYMLEKLFNILDLGQERVRPHETARELFPVYFCQQIEDVHHKEADEKNTSIYVYGAAGLVTAEDPCQPLAPGSLHVHASQTGGSLEQKGKDEQQMKQPLQRSEPSDSRLRIHLHCSPFSQEVPGCPTTPCAAERPQRYPRPRQP